MSLIDLLIIHPSAIAYISILLLIFLRKNNSLFAFIQTCYPVIISYILYLHFHNQLTIKYDRLIVIFNYSNNLIVLGFSIIAFVGNLYSLNRNNKFEVIIGNFYYANSLMCILAGDLISMFIALELMVCAVTILIFLDGSKINIKAARLYFLTHLISGGLILIGIAYIILNTGNHELISLTPLTNNYDKLFIAYCLMLVGCLINVAALPFHGWLIRCYYCTSGTSFLYLITFTTKVSVILVMKLFSGCQILYFIGSVMMLYGGVYACIERNLNQMLCYLAIAQIGFMLSGISVGNLDILISEYILVHIVYKALLVITFAMLADNYHIKNHDDFKNNPPQILNIALFIGCAMSASVPFSVSFSIKSGIIYNMPQVVYYVVVIMNILILISIPLKQYLLCSNKSSNAKISRFNTFILLFIMTILGALHITYQIDIKQHFHMFYWALLAIGLTISALMPINHKRTITFALDIPYFIIQKFITYYYAYVRYTKSSAYKQKTRNTVNLAKFIDQYLHIIAIKHNQPLAIFIVFTSLIITISFFLLKYSS